MTRITLPVNPFVENFLAPEKHSGISPVECLKKSFKKSFSKDSTGENRKSPKAAPQWALEASERLTKKRRGRPRISNHDKSLRFFTVFNEEAPNDLKADIADYRGSERNLEQWSWLAYHYDRWGLDGFRQFLRKCFAHAETLIVLRHKPERTLDYLVTKRLPYCAGTLFESMKAKAKNCLRYVKEYLQRLPKAARAEAEKVRETARLKLSEELRLAKELLEPRQEPAQSMTHRAIGAGYLSENFRKRMGLL